MTSDTANRNVAGSPTLRPLVIVPYLSDAQLEALEQRGISGIDLSGNGVVIAPGELLIRRTGQPNTYPQSTPIRNIYQGTSSLVPRVFLARPQYASVNEVFAEINRRGGSIVLSTVSKALRVLQEDLMIARDDVIRLVQPDKLLDSLQANYRPPVSRSKWVGKTTMPEPEFLAAATAAAVRLGSRLVLTGTNTGLRTAVAGREPVASFYCTARAEALATALGLQSTDRFPNVELLETEDPTVYFDTRLQDALPFAAPVQSYLEMARGEKRLRDLSGQLRDLVLTQLQQAGGIAT